MATLSEKFIENPHNLENTLSLLETLENPNDLDSQANWKGVCKLKKEVSDLLEHQKKKVKLANANTKESTTLIENNCKLLKNKDN